MICRGGWLPHVASNVFFAGGFSQGRPEMIAGGRIARSRG